MFKVLNVVDGIGWCGTKEQTYLITKYLALKGIESHIALAFDYDYMVKKLEGTPVKIHFFEEHKGGISRFNFKNILRLRKIIKENDYDFVIAHSSHALDYVIMATSFMREKPKIIALRRSGFKPSFLSKYFKYSKANRIVVVSKEVGEKLKKWKFFPERIRIIQSGIELQRFYPRPELREEVRKELGVKENEYMFINVANWQPWRKGQEVILKALKELPFRNFKMFFVGLDTDSEEAGETFKKYGLEKNCMGLGFRSDIEMLLQGADLFLFGSFSEGIAGALLQAMATGRIVISTNAGGIPEYLKDGENGFMVEVGDWRGMKEKILKALSLSEEERKRISKNAIRTVQNYSIENTVDKYIKLFEELKKG
ncbi:glycosyltransferase family 4 protein [Aquifex aeolicus]|uniref:Glucosyl transferase I n=1 Tax=Aquifex aeolicus (strain VF5) TaxID=224324 RepID=O67880_AQUAE|nr:glycosyltransferase family 4 protein [Aquifex aeolicus]AAC07836.1 glucosyl transferase I [Aquifex aeolicus VF5]